uniref:Nuclear transcription factor Y subunit n=1 Tax=Chromera velia CCMP2878 TaxID=1169474 RepID=A0A0G4FUZ8_9ALVE|mmetsp:Transcript_49607/g.97750  ORF Transcript_49607/g.97750 Transcript_49607/m.97750 type:complete len:320 (+) Transcript_49607:146-1105(+)|eukprot:Cvel_18781.t1-p1 / transcript=Cvel_18781.t1 / gene=Cvel_18781 / organism=Chromera_velia_CCMP2878 / gene_product=hypothetical protein / transcript_product=hypothetical protein / location=Cvel_scaffold1576:34699-37466(-) / protein_length=319 / sequence_SO=supercontig / SO=protein_coding / is_pseudo=false
MNSDPQQQGHPPEEIPSSCGDDAGHLEHTAVPQETVCPQWNDHNRFPPHHSEVAASCPVDPEAAAAEPVPLEEEVELVNPKQYERILKRREARALLWAKVHASDSRAFVARSHHASKRKRGERGYFKSLPLSAPGGTAKTQRAIEAPSAAAALPGGQRAFPSYPPPHSDTVGGVQVTWGGFPHAAQSSLEGVHMSGHFGSASTSSSSGSTTLCVPVPTQVPHAGQMSQLLEAHQQVLATARGASPSWGEVDPRTEMRKQRKTQKSRDQIRTKFFGGTEEEGWEGENGELASGVLLNAERSGPTWSGTTEVSLHEEMEPP